MCALHVVDLSEARELESVDLFAFDCVCWMVSKPYNNLFFVIAS